MNNDKVIELASTHSALIKEFNKVVNKLNDVEQENENLRVKLKQCSEVIKINYQAKRQMTDLCVDELLLPDSPDLKKLTKQ